MTAKGDHLMGNMSIRNIPNEAFHALKEQAAKNGRSTEAEVRAMIEEVAVSSKLGGFGTRLRKCFKNLEGDELDLSRDKTPAKPMVFE
jgi:plasmid stability protein